MLQIHALPMMSLRVNSMQQPRAHPQPSHSKQVILDFAIVNTSAAASFVLASFFNLSDQFYQWAMQYEDHWEVDELPIMLLVYFAGLLWFASRRMQESRRLMQNNHALLQRVMTVQETERKRLAQDLHDELGQYLNAIKVQATSLLLDKSQPADKLRTAQLIVNTAEHGYQAAREMMQSLRPVALDECGLSAALEHLVNTWRAAQRTQAQPVNYALTIDGNIDQFDETLNIALYRIVQESLNNTAKHANASQVTIDLTLADGLIILHYQDNGIGFDKSQINAGYGLLGIKERVDALRGSLSVETSLQSGTHLITSLPLTDHHKLTLESA